MSYLDQLQSISSSKILEYINNVSDEDVTRAIYSSNSSRDLIALLSPKAQDRLEEMATRARELHFQNFGKSISLFSPIYISNYCVNHCTYCDYNKTSDVTRHQMSDDEIHLEAKEMYDTNLQNILVLTGEDYKTSNIEYISNAIELLNQYFDNISIEIYPTTVDNYKTLVDSGVTGLALYQETYDEERYRQIHLSGPKKHFKWRLDGPERALMGGVRMVTIGALLGLSDWRIDTFRVAEHIRYLQNKYPEAELSISVPRIKKSYSDSVKLDAINDKELIQTVLAHRIYNPHVGITMTTRESPRIRDGLLPICISKMSAGVRTQVGGHTLDLKSDTSQFNISDHRSIDEIKKVIIQNGYQPVVRDWIRL